MVDIVYDICSGADVGYLHVCYAYLFFKYVRLVNVQQHPKHTVQKPCLLGTWELEIKT